MSEQPTALRLADWLEDQYDPTHNQEDAAAELRRLHAENERLHQINQSHEMKLSVRGYELQIEDLKAAIAELLETLKDATDAIEHWGAYSSDYFQQKWDLHSDINAARAAITRAEGKI
jgi:chromosome segregation ATPase